MVTTGISTASLFGRFHTEDALKELNSAGVTTTEVFLESYCEYNKKFGKILKKCKGKLDVRSVHTLTTQFEPQLYSTNERAQNDSFDLLNNTMQAAHEVGARFYTFHGQAVFKKVNGPFDIDRHAEITQKIIDLCGKYDVCLAYENVQWSRYNYVGFFNEIRKRTKGLKGTLDIKQARRADLSCVDLINEMGSDIVTVHLSDINENGKMCLPGKGVTDFTDLFYRLKDVGFDGAILIEAYQSDFDTMNDLYDSLDFITELKDKIFM